MSWSAEEICQRLRRFRGLGRQVVVDGERMGEVLVLDVECRTCKQAPLRGEMFNDQVPMLNEGHDDRACRAAECSMIKSECSVKGIGREEHEEEPKR